MYQYTSTNAHSDRTTRLALFSYCIYAFALTVLDEVYSLWCATSRYYGEFRALHDSAKFNVSLSVFLLRRSGFCAP